MVRYLSFGTAIVAAMLLPTSNADEPNNSSGVRVLKVELVHKKDWKNVGFKTPQATIQTFLWATREGNVETILKCFDDGASPYFTKEDKEQMKEAASAASGFQPLAVRRKGDTHIELKFNVVGWQDEPFVHALKLMNDEWKLDSSSSTRNADW